MTILIPAYEPDERLLILIEKLKARCSFNIIVIDDGSGDSYTTLFEKARENGCVVLTHSINKGKGNALKTGFRYLKQSGEQDGVVCADCDGQHQVEDILKIANSISKYSNKIIIGCRRFTGKVPIRSRFGNSVTRIIYTAATGNRLLDTQTGLRGYPSSMFDWLCGISGERFEYEMNVLLAASQASYQLQEVNIETIYRDNNKSSHFRVIVDSFRVYLPFLKFGATAIISAILDMALLLIISFASSNLFLAAVGARLCSSIFNYTMNKTFVFQKPGVNSMHKSLPKYFLLAIIVFSMNYTLLYTLNKGLLIPLFFAKLFTEAIVFIFSYWSQRKFVFI